MGVLSLIPDSLIEKVLTEEKITQAGDELLECNSMPKNGCNIAIIKKEKDGKYYIHKCMMEFKRGEWVIGNLEKSSKISDLIKRFLKWKNQAK